MRDVLIPRNEIVHPRDKPTGEAIFVGLEHIEPGTGRRIGSLPIRLEELTGRKARFRPGDIVYGYLRPYLNKVWVADFDGFSSVDQYVFEVVGAAPKYIAAYMRSPEFLSNAPIAETPGQLPRIRLDEILGVPITLPSVDDQLRIAAELTSQFAAVDDLSHRADARASSLRELRANTVDEPYDRAPNAWPRRGVESVARIQTGYAFKSEWFTGAGIRLLRNANVGHEAIDWTDVVRLPVELAHGFVQFQLAEGDTVLSLDRPIVAAGIKVARLTAADVPSLLLQRVARFIVGPDVDADYLYHFLLTRQFTSAISAHDHSLGVPHVSPRQVGSVVLPLPSLVIQRRIASQLRERLAAIDAGRAALESEREAIEGLTAALLRRAFRDVAA